MKVVFDYNKFVNGGETDEAAMINSVPIGSAGSISDEVHYRVQASAPKTVLFVSKSNKTYMVVWLDENSVSLVKLTTSGSAGEVIKPNLNFVAAIDILAEALCQ